MARSIASVRGRQSPPRTDALFAFRTQSSQHAERTQRDGIAEVASILQFWPWQDRVRCVDDAGEAFEPSGAGRSSVGAIDIR
jgi:hypothetical protein